MLLAFQMPHAADQARLQRLRAKLTFTPFSGFAFRDQPEAT
jgi:hypothetical protein